MATVIKVRDIENSQRRVLEHVIGQPLTDNQQVLIEVVDQKEESTKESALPDWCNVYEGLSDEQIADLEKTILQRADLTRPDAA